MIRSVVGWVVLYTVVVMMPLQMVEGHAVVTSEVKGGKGVVFRYDDGFPMAFADVKVFAPDGKGKPFQVGMTDRNGCFMFMPDRIGEWIVEVSDGMGHGAKITVLEEETVETGDKEVGNGIVGNSAGVEFDKRRTWSRVPEGVGVIFGLFGLYALFMRRGRPSPATQSKKVTPRQIDGYDSRDRIPPHDSDF